MAADPVTWEKVGGAAQEAGKVAWGTTKTLPEIAGIVISAILAMLGVLFLVLMIYAGYLWMTARGESKQVDSAKESLKNSLIGLIIVVASYAISNFILTNLIKATQ